MIGRREKLKNLLFMLFLFAYPAGISVGPAEADIYKYVDSKGILHFTNVPVASDCRFYIREEISPVCSTDRYDEIIEDAAKRYNVPFPLLKALIKAESDFDPSALSRSGAQGLMQIMPGTARELGVSNPFDPEESITGGARYLRKLLTMFNDKLPLALAAYNAGPGLVSRSNCIPPIQETQNFVQKVMNYYRIFKNDQYIPLTYQ